MNINDYTNYKEKTIAEFKTAITQSEALFHEYIKRKDIIGALEATKLKLKLENLLHKKNKDGSKDNYQSHKRT